MSSVTYGTWREGAYSYVCVHRPPKQLISKEIYCAEYEYNYEYFPPPIVISKHHGI